jgi:hypothetical protein
MHYANAPDTSLCQCLLLLSSWHYISGQFSIQAPRKPQKFAISLPQAPPKLLNLSKTEVSSQPQVPADKH